MNTDKKKKRGMDWKWAVLWIFSTQCSNASAIDCKWCELWVQFSHTSPLHSSHPYSHKLDTPLCLSYEKLEYFLSHIPQLATQYEYIIVA